MHLSCPRFFRGIEVGWGQSGGIHPPAGVPRPLAQQLQLVIHDVVAHGYVDALLPTVAVAAAIPASGALGCLLLVRQPGVTGRIAAVPVSPARHDPGRSRRPPRRSRWN